MTQHHAHAAAPNNAGTLAASRKPGPAPATAARPTPTPAKVPSRPAAPPPALARVTHDGAATEALKQTQAATGRGWDTEADQQARLAQRHHIATRRVG